MSKSCSKFLQSWFVCHLTFLVICCLLATTRGQSEETNEEILAWKAPRELKKLYPYFISGFDDDGTPINVLEFGRWDTRTTMEKDPKSQEVQDFKKYTYQMLVTMYESANILGTGTNDFVIIVDLDGFDHNQFAHGPTVAKVVDMARQFVQVNRGRIDRIKKVYLVNSNYLFTTVFQLFKPFLGDVSNRIELYGTNKDKWLPLVRKGIPADQVPAWLNGSKDWKPVKIFG